MAVTPIIPILSAAPESSNRRAFSSSAPVFLAVKKERATDLHSCLEDQLLLGQRSRKSSRRLQLRLTVNPAVTGLAKLVQDTTSKWSTMASPDLSNFFRPYVATLGIEYGDMQLIAEAYDILKRGLGLSEDEIADIFFKWNKGVLDSFLIDITANILKFKDEDGEPVLSKILDKAGQKGTGKWTAIAALEAGTAGE